RFDFDSIRILPTDSQAKENHVALLARSVRRARADVLIMASRSRRGMPSWLLGSFSETAALLAGVPVLIIKPTVSDAQLSRDPRLLLSVDAAAPPSTGTLQWIGRM